MEVLVQYAEIMDDIYSEFAGVWLVGRLQQIQSCMKLSRVKSTEVCKVIGIIGGFFS